MRPGEFCRSQRRFFPRGPVFVSRGEFCRSRSQRRFFPRPRSRATAWEVVPVDPPDRAAVALARSQAVWSPPTARRRGIGRHAVAHRVRSGWLRRRYRGVFIVGPVESPRAEAMAAVLAVGEAALLSHWPSAGIWEIVPQKTVMPEVTLVGRTRRGPADVRVHRIGASILTTPRGITTSRSPRRPAPSSTWPPTSPTETSTRAVEEAQLRHSSPNLSLTEQSSATPTIGEQHALRQAIQTEPALTRSEAERRLLELIRAAGLPAPQTNVRIGRHEVDLLWPDLNLIVEVDGYVSTRRVPRSSGIGGGTPSWAPRVIACCGSPGAAHRRAGSPRRDPRCGYGQRWRGPRYVASRPR